MARAFRACGEFNQPIGGWQTGKVTNVYAMFYGASAFDQPIGGWQTGKVTNMQQMFHYASAFDGRQAR